MTMSKGINVSNIGKKCCVDGCEGSSSVRGLCKNHYDKYLKERNPEYRKKQLINCTEWARKNRERSREIKRHYAEKILPLQKRDILLRSKYGLSNEDYNAMLINQNNQCAICGKHKEEIKNKRHLHVDHCHTTGRIRGLLCFRCNFGLGWFQHDPKRFEMALAHLNFKNEYVDKVIPLNKINNIKSESKDIHIGFINKGECKNE